MQIKIRFCEIAKTDFLFAKDFSCAKGMLNCEFYFISFFELNGRKVYSCT